MRTLVQATHDYSGDVEESRVVPQKATIPFHKPGAQ
jgi:hypothetical protein